MQCTYGHVESANKITDYDTHTRTRCRSSIGHIIILIDCEYWVSARNSSSDWVCCPNTNISLNSLPLSLVLIPYANWRDNPCTLISTIKAHTHTHTPAKLYSTYGRNKHEQFSFSIFMANDICRLANILFNSYFILFYCRCSALAAAAALDYVCARLSFHFENRFYNLACGILTLRSRLHARTLDCVSDGRSFASIEQPILSNDSTHLKVGNMHGSSKIHFACNQWPLARAQNIVVFTFLVIASANSLVFSVSTLPVCPQL